MIKVSPVLTIVLLFFSSCLTARSRSHVTQEDLPKTVNTSGVMKFNEFINLLYQVEYRSEEQLNLLDIRSIGTIRHFFSSSDTVLEKDRYALLLIVMMDQHADDTDIDKEIRDQLSN